MLSRLLPTALLLICHGSSLAQRQNPFAPPQAKYHYAPNRTCDLLHVAIELDVDYPGRTIVGRAVNTLSPLRSGIEAITLHAGKGLDIKGVKVDGKPVAFERNEKDLILKTGPLVKGKRITVEIGYVGKNQQGRAFGQGGGGWHWIQPRANASDPNRVGFWTQGESEFNSEWVPTWDYPNDLATSETKTTVPADWSVIGNGALVAATPSADGKRKTFHWKMSLPHATYLIAVYGGPFDIQKDVWEGVDLWYVVPKGSGSLIDDSFGDTKDMLSFYSKVLGVKYPWNKYAQVAMYDFGGGMENVSATILGEGSLTEARDGFRRMAGLNAHELAHQWFGDLVTCVHWGDVWLNESFATFMEGLYMEQSRGADAYAWEVDDNTRGYLQEARRYKRPISTKLYPNPEAMFDSHTYPKGAVVLHTLRRFLGDEAFFAGLNYYLTKWRHTPVESAQLRRAFTEATGINVEPFWAQWIEKPGHPVLDYTWTWKPDGPESGPGKIILTVKQLQDTSDGTPIYDIPAKIAYVREGLAPARFVTAPVHISKAEETFEIPSASRALTVVLDPDHDFLREIPELHWSPQELPLILVASRNAPDRQEALNRLLAAGAPTDALLKTIVEQVAADKDPEQPAFRQLNALVDLAKPELRSFWMSQLSHGNADRQATAVNALAKLPQDTGTIQRLRGLIHDKAPIQVVVNAIVALSNWDAAANKDVFEKAKNIPDRRGRIQRAAEAALGKIGGRT